MDGTRNGNQGQSVSWRVEGMDCASCVAKVEKSITRLPGVTDVSVNLIAERLIVRLEPGTTDAATIERSLAVLGYMARLLPANDVVPAASENTHDDGHHHSGRGDEEHNHTGHDPADHDHGGALGHSHADHEDPADATKSWYATGKARLVWLLGALVLAAYALSLLLPDRLTYPLFLAATPSPWCPSAAAPSPWRARAARSPSRP